MAVAQTRVICDDLQGEFQVFQQGSEPCYRVVPDENANPGRHKPAGHLEDGRAFYLPSAFENMAGRQRSQNWKKSVHVFQDGVKGETLLRWLKRQGVIQLGAEWHRHLYDLPIPPPQRSMPPTQEGGPRMGYAVAGVAHTPAAKRQEQAEQEAAQAAAVTPAPTATLAARGLKQGHTGTAEGLTSTARRAAPGAKRQKPAAGAAAGRAPSFWAGNAAPAGDAHEQARAETARGVTSTAPGAAPEAKREKPAESAQAPVGSQARTAECHERAGGASARISSVQTHTAAPAAERPNQAEAAQALLTPPQMRTAESAAEPPQQAETMPAAECDDGADSDTDISIGVWDLPPGAPQEGLPHVAFKLEENECVTDTEIKLEATSADPAQAACRKDTAAAKPERSVSSDELHLTALRRHVLLPHKRSTFIADSQDSSGGPTQGAQSEEDASSRPSQQVQHQRGRRRSVQILDDSDEETEAARAPRPHPEPAPSPQQLHRRSRQRLSGRVVEDSDEETEAAKGPVAQAELASSSRQLQRQHGRRLLSVHFLEDSKEEAEEAAKAPVAHPEPAASVQQQDCEAVSGASNFQRAHSASPAQQLHQAPNRAPRVQEPLDRASEAQSAQPEPLGQQPEQLPCGSNPESEAGQKKAYQDAAGPNETHSQPGATPDQHLQQAPDQPAQQPDEAQDRAAEVGAVKSLQGPSSGQQAPIQATLQPEKARRSAAEPQVAGSQGEASSGLSQQPLRRRMLQAPKQTARVLKDSSEARDAPSAPAAPSGQQVEQASYMSIPNPEEGKGRAAEAHGAHSQRAATHGRQLQQPPDQSARHPEEGQEETQLRATGTRSAGSEGTASSGSSQQPLRARLRRRQDTKRCTQHAVTDAKRKAKFLAAQPMIESPKRLWEEPDKAGRQAGLAALSTPARQGSPVQAIGWH